MLLVQQFHASIFRSVSSPNRAGAVMQGNIGTCTFDAACRDMASPLIILVCAAFQKASGSLCVCRAVGRQFVHGIDLAFASVCKRDTSGFSNCLRPFMIAIHCSFDARAFVHGGELRACQAMYRIRRCCQTEKVRPYCAVSLVCYGAGNGSHRALLG